MRGARICLHRGGVERASEILRKRRTNSDPETYPSPTGRGARPGPRLRAPTPSGCTDAEWRSKTNGGGIGPALPRNRRESASNDPAAQVIRLVRMLRHAAGSRGEGSALMHRERGEERAGDGRGLRALTSSKSSHPSWREMSAGTRLRTRLATSTTDQRWARLSRTNLQMPGPATMCEAMRNIVKCHARLPMGPAVRIHIYISVCIQRYTYLHVYLHTDVHAYLQASTHVYVQSCMYSYIHIKHTCLLCSPVSMRCFVPPDASTQNLAHEVTTSTIQQGASQRQAKCIQTHTYLHACMCTI